ncbi:hypothetical protein QBC38DRAFT_371120 [Podospora fimiseda]|uniref:Amine oxidase domain-containing protein n=1 Tax=Podospora fimiseda TaxID=252190 RepID=A0AAN7BJH3_9PEZI|nr:hypothetical protein QBC38DRAFT_371120 [Podospora fimiseda]
MDAYSMSFSSSSNIFKTPSKILQDRERHLQFDRSPRKLSIMDRVLQDIPQLETLEPTKRPHIGIVGAGFAGLRCADILLRYGFQVTILEARNRLGGRIYQERLPSGQFIDMGANWIHGTTDNPIMDLARETETSTTHEWDEQAFVFDQVGQFVDPRKAQACSNMMWEIIREASAHSRANQHGSGIDPKETLWEFFQQEVLKRVPKTEKNYEEKRKLILQMADLWGAFVGSPVQTQSLKFFWMEECIEGENLFVTGTYRKILEKVAQPAINGAKIHLQARITKVYGKSTSPCNTVKLETSDGRTFEFAQVVLTTPLGWLKQNLQAFHPPLPARLTQAIQNLGYGCLEKIYMTFPKAFWLIPDPKGHKFTGFGQWLSPSYTPETNPAKWTNEVVELGSVKDGGHPTLLFYTYGEQSRHITSSLRRLKSEKDKREWLIRFFEPYYSKLPSYNPREDVPVAAIATDWLGDDLAGNGSYVNFQKGLREGDKDIEVMRAGVPGEGIWLAGEHTAPFIALGTSTGAYWSGEGVASKVAGKVLGRGEV